MNWLLVGKVLPPSQRFELMSYYKVDISITDNKTGEILGSTVLDDFDPTYNNSHYYLFRWVKSFVRGLSKGNELNISFNATLKFF